MRAATRCPGDVGVTRDAWYFKISVGVFPLTLELDEHPTKSHTISVEEQSRSWVSAIGIVKQRNSKISWPLTESYQPNGTQDA